MGKKRESCKCKCIKGKGTYQLACDTKNVRDRIEEISAVIAVTETEIMGFESDLRELKEIKSALELVLNENKKEVKKGI